MTTQPIPEGFHEVTPFLVVEDAAGLIEFIAMAFGGKERTRVPGPDGKLMHAEVTIGGSTIMLSDRMEGQAPASAFLHLYLADVDEAFRRAISGGASELSAPQDQFYGDRTGTLKDSWGNTWAVATHIEDVSDEEISRRLEAMHQAGVA